MNIAEKIANTLTKIFTTDGDIIKAIGQKKIIIFTRLDKIII
tara:strand:- start:1466 stop:1591 length:126 start_codon:yes stop_codon:yes gene_type:complete